MLFLTLAMLKGDSWHIIDTIFPSIFMSHWQWWTHTSNSHISFSLPPPPPPPIMSSSKNSYLVDCGPLSQMQKIYSLFLRLQSVSESLLLLLSKVSHNSSLVYSNSKLQDIKRGSILHTHEGPMVRVWCNVNSGYWSQEGYSAILIMS